MTVSYNVTFMICAFINTLFPIGFVITHTLFVGKFDDSLVSIGAERPRVPIRALYTQKLTPSTA